MKATGSTIAGIVLAAGSSERMSGRNKLLVEIAGKTILEWSVQHAVASRLHRVVLVTGRQCEQYQMLLRHYDIEVIQNRDHLHGMSSSIKMAIEYLGNSVEGAMILLADQPALKAQTIDRYLTTFFTSKTRIVAGKYGDRIGSPVLFHSDFFPELCSLTGDTGARRVLDENASAIVTVDVPAVQGLDLDSPDDLPQLHKILAQQSA